jgi:prepilin-type N-terminal cleavage/methylation domain-containing protein
MLSVVRKRGFTLAEILVALAIIALLTAVVIPTIGGRLRQSQASAIADELTNLTTAISAYRENVLKYPYKLDLLTNTPVAGTSQDICGTLMVAANVNKWQGPYLARPILTNTDFPIGDATVNDQLVRTPVSGAGVGTLQINMDVVDTVAAVALEAQFDGNANFTTGSIVWTQTNPGVGTLTYSIPIRGC